MSNEKVRNFTTASCKFKHFTIENKIITLPTNINRMKKWKDSYFAMKRHGKNESKMRIRDSNR